MIGRVRLTTKVPGKPLASTAYPRRTVGDHSAPSLPEIRNVVVYIKDASFRGALPAKRAELRQEHETFIPAYGRDHARIVGRLSERRSVLSQRVFAVARGEFQSRPLRTRAEPRPRVHKAGTVKVYCDIHSHMSATILVFDHPYFTIPELDGILRAAGGAGRRSTRIVGGMSASANAPNAIRVEAGKAASIELTVPVPVEGDAP